jgi:integrase
MMTERISKIGADKALRMAKKSGKEVYYWDAAISGFGVKATPPSTRHKNGHCVYVLQYRSPEKRTPNGAPMLRKMQLGIHGQGTTAEQARKKAEKCRGQLSDGTDPQEERSRDQADKEGDISVSDLCDSYLDEAPSIVIPNKGRPKKASTLAIDASNINRHIKPTIGKLKIRSVTTGDIERMQADIAAGKTRADVKTKKQGRARVTGGRGIAARCVALLGGIYSFAHRRRLVDENPVKGVQLYGLEPRERYLTNDELSRLGEVLTDMDASGFNPQAIAAVRLLLFTGARKNEIISLCWDDVDFENHTLNLPDSKTGKKSIPLGAPALELLQSLSDDGRKGDFVLPGSNPSKPYNGLQKAWQKIRARAKLDDVRVHDLRHSFATTSTAGGNSLFLVGKVLGHAQTRTTERYAHTDVDPVRAVADRTSRQIAEAMEGKKGKVVSIGGGDD